MDPSLNLAVVGAGPAGLALALLASRTLPRARVTVFDARTAAHDISADPRTIALALGSVQLFERLHVWPTAQAQPILEVHVSQYGAAHGEVRLRARDEGVSMLGAVLRYGGIVAPLQAAWLQQVAQEPDRLAMRFGARIQAIDADGRQATVNVADAGVEAFDLVVVAEGGVFADGRTRLATPTPPLRHDYRQTAWVGTATFETPPAHGTAFERFTPDGPVALLPLVDGRAALVWCVPSQRDPVAALTDAERIAALNERLPAAAGRIAALTPLKAFPLGLEAQRTLVNGRVVRIGNAAQTLHPVAGQGLNLGLRDAFALVQALRSGGDVDAVLRRLEWRRAADRWPMIAATDFLARSFTWELPGATPLRAAALAALQRLGPAKSLLARQMMFGSR